MGVIFITGGPGTGKSTVAALLHEKLGCPWYEFGWIQEFRQKNPHTLLDWEEEETLSVENLLLVTDNYLRHGFDHFVYHFHSPPFLCKDISKISYIINDIRKKYNSKSKK